METILFFKRNDQEVAPGMERFAFRHGDLVSIERCNREDVSEKVKRAFLSVSVPENKKLFLSQFLESEGDFETMSPQCIQRKKRLTLDKMKTFSDDINSSKELPVINYDKFKENDFTDAMVRLPIFKDLEAISAGPATIGAGGAAPNYLTWDLFGADIINQTNDVEVTEVTNNTNGGVITLTHQLNGHNLKLLTTPNPLGNPGAGILTRINHNSYMWIFAMTGPGNVYHSLGNIQRDVAAAAATRGIFVLNAVPVAFNLYFCENIVNLNNKGGALLRSSDAGPVIYAFNNEVWDGAVGIEIDGGDGNSNSIYSNINFLNLSTKTIDMNNNGGTLRNLALFGGVSELQQIANCNGYNTFAEDATNDDANWNDGSGNQSNKTASDGWLSLDDTSENFLDLKEDGIFDGAGVTNAAAINRLTCIRGRTVPGPNGTSVGAAERAPIGFFGGWGRERGIGRTRTR